MSRRELENSVSHQGYRLVGRTSGWGYGGEEEVIDGEGDEWGGETAEVLFEGGGDGINVEIWIGDVEVVGTFEAFFYPLDLGVAAGFAVDTFDIHAYIGKGISKGKKTCSETEMEI